MIHKCQGCGAPLQTKSKEKIGYTEKKENKLCNRCFRIQNYSEYHKVETENQAYIEILQKINKTNDLVVFVVDMFLFHQNIIEMKKYLKNDILLVLTKRDILPNKIDNQKWIAYFQNMGLSFIDIEVVSSFKNYHLDALKEKIKAYKKSKFVYIIGYTNAGKTTLINQIVKNYAQEKKILTTSMMPSTTLDMLPIEIEEDLTIIDTPGLLISNSLMNIADEALLKKIMPKKEIKPITYQIKGKQYIQIEDFLFIEAEEVNLTLYMSNALSIKRLYTKKQTYTYQKEINVNKNEDFVIEGLGFITITNNATIKIDTKYSIDIYTRKKII